MNNPTKLIMLFSAICLIALLPLKYCNTPYKPDSKQHYIDSLLEVNKAKDIQIGFALAEAQTASDRAVKAELAAKQRDTVYLTRIKTIKQLAPDTCQPYLEAMGKECDTLIMAHVNNEMAKDTLIAKKDAVIELYAAKDSTSQLVIGEQGKQLKESEKEVRKQKRGKVVAWCVGVGLGILYIITNTF